MATPISRQKKTMDLLPDREQGRPLAIGLVVLVLVLVYLVGFHWFVLRHAGLSEQIAAVREDVNRFAAAAAMRETVEQRMQQVRARRGDKRMFLPGGNFDAAAAQMTQRLKQIIATESDHVQACNVISNQNVRPREKERFEKVLVKVRMRCNLADFVKVIRQLQDGLPLVFIDGVNVYQRYTAQQRQRRSNIPMEELDIRFDMFGYLSSPPPAADA